MKRNVTKSARMRDPRMNLADGTFGCVAISKVMSHMMFGLLALGRLSSWRGKNHDLELIDIENTDQYL